MDHHCEHVGFNSSLQPNVRGMIRETLEFEIVKMQASKGVDMIDGGQILETQVCIMNFKLNTFDDITYKHIMYGGQIK